MTAKLAKLEHIARQEMDASSPRRFAVLEPLLVRLSGLPPGGLTAELANLPRDPSKGTRQMAIVSDVYIERSDFREVDDPKILRARAGQGGGAALDWMHDALHLCRARRVDGRRQQRRLRRQPRVRPAEAPRAASTGSPSNRLCPPWCASTTCSSTRRTLRRLQLS